MRKFTKKILNPSAARQYLSVAFRLHLHERKGMATAQQRKLDEIRNDLFSDNDTLVAKAIARCEEEGSAPMVEPLLAFYASQVPNALKQRVAELLGSLKVSNVEGYFLDALAKREWKHIHKEIVGFMWNTGLQPVEAVIQITELAASGEYALTLECLTLLESIEDPIAEEQLLESIAIVHRAMSDGPDSDYKKLLSEYLRVLNMQRMQNDLIE